MMFRDTSLFTGGSPQQNQPECVSFAENHASGRGLVYKLIADFLFRAESIRRLTEQQF